MSIISSMSALSSRMKYSTMDQEDTDEIFSSVHAVVNPKARHALNNFEEILGMVEDETGVDIKFSRMHYIVIGSWEKICTARALLEEQIQNNERNIHQLHTDQELGSTKSLLSTTDPAWRRDVVNRFEEGGHVNSWGRPHILNNGDRSKDGRNDKMTPSMMISSSSVSPTSSTSGSSSHRHKDVGSRHKDVDKTTVIPRAKDDYPAAIPRAKDDYPAAIPRTKDDYPAVSKIETTYNKGKPNTITESSGPEVKHVALPLRVMSVQDGLLYANSTSHTTHISSPVRRQDEIHVETTETDTKVLDLSEKTSPVISERQYGSETKQTDGEDEATKSELSDDDSTKSRTQETHGVEKYLQESGYYETNKEPAADDATYSEEDRNDVDSQSDMPRHSPVHTDNHDQSYSKVAPEVDTEKLNKGKQYTRAVNPDVANEIEKEGSTKEETAGSTKDETEGSTKEETEGSTRDDRKNLDENNLSHGTDGNDEPAVFRPVPEVKSDDDDSDDDNDGDVDSRDNQREEEEDDEDDNYDREVIKPFCEEILIEENLYEYMQQNATQHLTTIKDQYGVDIVLTKKEANVAVATITQSKGEKFNLDHLEAAKHEFTTIYQNVILCCVEEVHKLDRKVSRELQQEAYLQTMMKYPDVLIKETPPNSRRHIFVGTHEKAKAARHFFMKQATTTKLEFDGGSSFQQINYGRFGHQYQTSPDPGHADYMDTSTLHLQCSESRELRDKAELAFNALNRDAPGDPDVYCIYQGRSVIQDVVQNSNNHDSQLDAHEERHQAREDVQLDAHEGRHEEREYVQSSKTRDSRPDTPEVRQHTGIDEYDDMPPLEPITPDYAIDTPHYNREEDSDDERHHSDDHEVKPGPDVKAGPGPDVKPGHDVKPGPDENNDNYAEEGTDHDVEDDVEAAEHESHLHNGVESAKIDTSNDRKSGKHGPNNSTERLSDSDEHADTPKPSVYDAQTSSKHRVLKNRQPEVEWRESDSDEDLNLKEHIETTMSGAAVEYKPKSVNKKATKSKQDNSKDFLPSPEVVYDLPEPKTQEGLRKLRESIINDLIEASPDDSEMLVNALLDADEIDEQHNVKPKDGKRDTVTSKEKPKERPGMSKNGDSIVLDDAEGEKPQFTSKLQEDGTIANLCDGSLCTHCTETTQKLLPLDCGHEFCVSCIRNPRSMPGDSCPVCGAVFIRVRLGQPEGTMSHIMDKKANMQHFVKHGTMMITFNFPADTIQGEDGDEFTYPNTNIITYLPNNNEGRTAFKLYMDANKQKKLFQVVCVRGVKGVIQPVSGLIIKNDQNAITKEYLAELTTKLKSLTV